MIQVLLVEDDPMARQLLEIYIDKSENYELAGSIESALFAEAFCRTHKVEVILMDVCTAMNANGIDAAADIKKHLPNIKIVVITSQPECSYIDRARAAGVDSFWYKSATAELNTSLEAGNLNGAENGITNYLDNGFYQTAPCFIPDSHLFGCGVILVSQSTWDGLSEQEREWMRTAARAGGEACYAYNLEHERDCEKRLKEMNLTLLEVADPEKWQEVCESLYGQQSPEIRELAEKIRRKEY